MNLEIRQIKMGEDILAKSWPLLPATFYLELKAIIVANH
jgi:hypothetical protein